MKKEIKIKPIDTELPDLIKEMIEYKKKLIGVISKSLGIPKKYFNDRNPNTKKIQ